MNHHRTLLCGFVAALSILSHTASAQSLGERDIVFGTDLKAETVVKKAKALAKRLVNPKAANYRARGDQRRTYFFSDANKDMPYRVCVPDSWDGQSEMTMVLFLHGGWNDESSYLDQNDKQLVKVANKYGVLLVSPLGADGAFGNFLRLPATFGHEEEMLEIMNDVAGRIQENYRSEQDVVNVIELVLAEYPVNRSAMYVMGHSMGGGGTWYIGAKYPDYWHGLLPISGPFTMKRDYPWERLRRKTIFMTEGLQAGASLSGSRDLYNFAKNEINLDITYKEVQGDHGGMFPAVLEDCFKFMTKPTVHITSPAADSIHIFIAPKEEIAFADIALAADATAHNSQVAKVDFYDGKKLIDSKTVAPYEAIITTPTSANHTLRAVVTDNNGETSQATAILKDVAASRSYNFTQSFTLGDNVPQGWYVCNGKTKRTGSINFYSDGPRILHFTSKSRGFEYGIMVQSVVSRVKAGWAKFGTTDAGSKLTLHAGHYALKYKVCNWNQPEFKPVTICIEHTNGQEVASQTYTPTVNIGGDEASKFSAVEQQTFEFDIAETADYVIAFYTDGLRNSDFVLGQLLLQALSFETTGIRTMQATSNSTKIYDLLGRQCVQPRRGLYLISTPGSKAKKVFRP